MKTLNILLIASAIAVAKPQSAKEAAPATTQAGHLSKSDPAASAHFQIGIGKLYEGYLNIQQALAKDDFKESKTGALSLFGLLKAVPATGLDKSTKSRWDSSAVSMIQVQHFMTASKDIAEMRKHFSELTPLLAGALEKYGAKTNGPVYLFHCPMHGPHGSDWMQKSKITANPFFGQSMPECGSLVREVKAK